PFLMGKLASSNQRESQWALRLIQLRLYRHQFTYGARQEFASDRTVITRMDPKRGVDSKSLIVMHRRALSLADLEGEIDGALQQPQRLDKRRFGISSDEALEILLPRPPNSIEYQEIEGLIANHFLLTGKKLQRLTLIISDSDGDEPDYRTFEPDSEGIFCE